MPKNSNEETLGYGRGWHSYYTETPNELFEEKCTLTPAQTLIYIYLLRCVNEGRNGCVVWPSYATIARCTRTSRRTAIDAVSVLVEKMYIFKRNRPNSSNNYLMNHPATSKDWA